MIAYIEGKLLSQWDKTCIILTDGGVGYEIRLTDPTFSRLPAVGEKFTLYISLITREDALELYGFETLEEKRAFEILTAISKVGARTALAILSIFRPNDLYQIATCGDFQQLTAVSGVGNKTAQHIFLELKYRIKALGAVPTDIKPVSGSAPVMVDALAALVNLGYTEEECSGVVRQILEEDKDLDVSALIRQALKRLSKGKV